MLTIWFIGIYVIFILQQITIFYLVSKINNLHKKYGYKEYRKIAEQKGFMTKLGDKK